MGHAGCVFLVPVLVLTFVAGEAAAQGRGRPKRPQSAAPTQIAPAAGTTPAPVFRQFGTWLDDASTMTSGEGRTGIGVGYWRTPDGSQLDLPMFDVGYAVSSRVQLSASVPFYHVPYRGGTARGLDDIYLAAKVVAVDPSLNRRGIGLALSPLVEVLSTVAPGESRVGWGLPVSMEARQGAVRAYGSAGYFSRGALFSGAALEWTARSGVVLTGALTGSYSVRADPLSDAAGLSRSRVDVSAGVGIPVSAAAAAYVSVGRSLSSTLQGGTIVGINTGLSIRLAPGMSRP